MMLRSYFVAGLALSLDQVCAWTWQHAVTMMLAAAWRRALHRCALVPELTGLLTIAGWIMLTSSARRSAGTKMATEATRNKIDILMGAVMLTGSVAFALIGVEYNRMAADISLLTADTNSIKVSITASMEALKSHVDEGAYWQRVIEGNRLKLERAGHRIAELSTQPAARPDAFTGTEGQALVKALMRIQQQLDDLRRTPDDANTE